MMSAWRGTTAVMTIPTLDTTLLSNANLLFWFLGLVFRVENSGLCGLEDACSVGRDVGACEIEAKGAAAMSNTNV